MLGNTPWPPHGDIKSPNERGRVSQFAGNRYVAAGSRSEPGPCGFTRPSIITSATTAEISLVLDYPKCTREQTPTRVETYL